MIPPEEIVLRLGASVLFGGVIGFERGYNDHPAGLRTHTLVALASTVFMILSLHALHVEYPTHPGVSVTFDPTRIASYVVAGIGFLGGGAIARTGFKVKGLTTAASLWLVTATGMSVGVGLYLLAFAGTLLGISVLTLFRLIERRPEKRITRRIALHCDASARLSALLEHVAHAGIKPETYDVDRSIADGAMILTIEIRQPVSADLATHIATLSTAPGLLRIVTSHQSSNVDE